MKKLQLWMVVLSLVAFAASATAQIQNGQFTGVVTDPSGAAIANAKVTITNMATNLTVSATTNQAGLYTVKELPIGLYKITVEAAGFKTSSHANVTLNAGTSEHVDFKMELGQTKEIIEVSGEVAPVNVEDSKLSTTVSSTQIANLPLNGRNVYDLMQLAPGAVNVAGTDFENGHGTVVNGLREDFNGFLINGISNKGLSGGVVATPIQDSVQEFQQLQLNVSAQYGNSAGSINNLVTKSGTNGIHGSAWDYVRNDVFDANAYFLNQFSDPHKDPTGTLCATDHSKCFKPPVRFNQYGGTLGGPIIKDKLFFFVSGQGDHFNTTGTPATILQETPQWRQAVAAGAPNSVANLLYTDFVPRLGTNNPISIDNYITSGTSPSGFSSYADYMCPDSYAGLPQASVFAARMQAILGVRPAVDNAKLLSATGKVCSTPMVAQPGSIGRDAVTGVSSLPFQGTSVAVFGSQNQINTAAYGNLFNGWEASARLDYLHNSNNRFFAQVGLLNETDGFGPCHPSCTRGFQNPTKWKFPNGQFSFVHTFSPRVLNEFRAGYTQNYNPYTSASFAGVPQIGSNSGAFDDGNVGFGSYSGYPQFFKEHIYTYSDMVSISHGNHNMKVGADFRRNIENSQFSVARPSYEIFDSLMFAADLPAEQVAGVNPGICAPPCKSINPSPVSQLEGNVRHWRNLEVGAFFQDDWKATRRLTLNLGLRWDLFTRHTELDNLATTFLLGPGNTVLDGVISANNPANCANPALAQVAGGCGPGTGGFAPASSLGPNRYKDFGPRVGFAYDVFGDGKTSLRGGFGISYEGTLYNPLSNSRWNPPYYSFNIEDNALNGGSASTVYGPTTCTGAPPATTCVPSGAAPTFSGPPTNPYQGVGAQAQGNITGWDPSNHNTGYLTGIVFPKGIDDPYVYNYFFSVQREIMPKLVIEADYVGTTGHKLFRAENVNRYPGSVLPAGVQVTDNFGRSWVGNGGYANNNYGNLRNWQNVVNSNYNSLQLQVRKQMSHGLMINGDYTYSHSIDNGSTWHSGATTSNGAAAGEGYTTDQTLPMLDRGNSIYDIRQRLVLNYVWQLPGQNLRGVKGAVLGGWSYNGIWAFQSGPHWEPYTGAAARIRDAGGHTNSACSAGTTTAAFFAAGCHNIGGDYNLDHGRNDRPESTIASFVPSRSDWANGLGQPFVASNFSRPCLACVSNLGRNTFLGPGQWFSDMTLAKNFRITERFAMKFEAQGFNVFNRANFILATSGGSGHNEIRDLSFGKAAGTLNARQLQLGLKLSF